MIFKEAISIRRTVLFYIFICMAVFVEFSTSIAQIKEARLKKIYSLSTDELNVSGKEIILSRPISFDFDKDGNLYVLDTGIHKIMKFDNKLRLVWEKGGKGPGPGEFSFPIDIYTGAFALSDSGELYVAEKFALRIQVFNNNGDFIRLFCRFPFMLEKGMAVDSNGNVYVHGDGNYRIYVFNKKGELIRSIVEPILKDSEAGFTYNAFSFTINKSGELFIAYTFFPILRKYNALGELLWEKRLDFKCLPRKVRKKLNSNTPLSYFLKHKHNIPENIRRRNPSLLQEITTDNGKIYILMLWSVIMELDSNGSPQKLYYIDEDYGNSNLNICLRTNNKLFFLNTEGNIWILKENN